MFQILDSENPDEFHFSLIEEAIRQEEFHLQAEVYEESSEFELLQCCNYNYEVRK